MDLLPGKCRMALIITGNVVYMLKIKLSLAGCASSVLALIALTYFPVNMFIIASFKDAV